MTSNSYTLSRKRQIPVGICRFQLNPPLRVGEILLRNVKFSLRPSEIAAAVGARSTDVFKIFFSESFVIGVICVVLSTVASVLFCGLLNAELVSGLGTWFN